MKILLGISYTMIWFSIIMLFRNQQVYKFRRRLLDALDDIHRHDIIMRCLDEMREVDYHEMVYKFWRSPKSFYTPELIKLLDDK